MLQWGWLSRYSLGLGCCSGTGYLDIPLAWDAAVGLAIYIFPGPGMLQWDWLSIYSLGLGCCSGTGYLDIPWAWDAAVGLLVMQAILWGIWLIHGTGFYWTGGSFTAAAVRLRIHRQRVLSWTAVMNSLRPCDAYMCQWTRPPLVQIMTCHLFGTKPSSEPMLAY